MGQIRIPDPEFWWLARREDIGWLEDPDVADGGVRWPDRDRLNWRAIAPARGWGAGRGGVGGPPPGVGGRGGARG